MPHYIPLPSTLLLTAIIVHKHEISYAFGILPSFKGIQCSQIVIAAKLDAENTTLLDSATGYL